MPACTSISRTAATRRTLRAGFTLGELLVSSAIAAILLTSTAGALMYVLEAADSSQDPTVQRSSNQDIVDQITHDLEEAITVPERTATAITLTVPDRDGDGQPETIRYLWSGAAGGPLTLRYNTDAPVTLAADVYSFDLTYLWRMVGPPTGGCCLMDGSCVVLTQADCAATALTYYRGDDTTCDGYTCLQESAERVLVSRDWPSAADIQDLSLKNNGAAEWFKPVLPTNCVSWKITRLKLKLQRNSSATGTLTIAVRNVDSSNKPTGTALASYALNITTVSSAAYVWVDIPLTAISGLDPSAKLSVQATTPSSSTIGYLAYDWQGTVTSMGWMTGNATGTTWTNPTSTRVMEYFVYGTYTTIGPPQ